MLLCGFYYLDLVVFDASGKHCVGNAMYFLHTNDAARAAQPNTTNNVEKMYLKPEDVQLALTYHCEGNTHDMAHYPANAP